jgi:hypothetical protein
MKRESISKTFLEEMKKNEEEMKKNEELIKKQKIMKKIELQTEKKIILELQTGKITNPITEMNTSKQQHNQDILQTLLSDGAKEFKEKMGRSMTYGEMREMYG